MSWEELWSRCRALEEPFKSQAEALYVEAHRTAEAYPSEGAAIMWQLTECITSVEWDAAHGAPDPFLLVGGKGEDASPTGASAEPDMPMDDTFR